MRSEPVVIRRLSASEIDVFRDLLATFGKAFADTDTYTGAQPSDSYLERLLGGPHFIALAAVQGEAVIGGLAAYQLDKFEQERSEIYIYDLAVDAEHRRKGVATRLITELRAVAAQRRAYVIFVQADYGDDAAIALYTKLGTREDVLHFDIPPMDPAHR
jgi:aminoglycoside 3-N-acetyltransferase I